MKTFDLVAMCLRNLTQRKFRTFLTVSGIIISTCFIIIMMSMGIGTRINNERMLEEMADLTIIEVNSRSEETPLTDDAVRQMQALNHVVIASPTMYYNPNNGYIELYAGRKDRYSNYMDVMGVYPEALEKLGYTASRGELKLGTSPDGKTINVIMGPQVPYYFEDTTKRWPNNRVDGNWEDPSSADPFFDVMETDMLLKVFSNKDGVKEQEYKVQVSGIIQPRDNDWESVWTTYISIDDLKRIKADYDKANKTVKERGEVESYNNVKIKVDHVDNVREVQDYIDDKMGFHTYSMEETREAVQKNARQAQMSAGFVGGVALILAAISIINTMITSVYERTREIGVMKVLGCLLGDIRAVFLVESGIMGVIGGGIGVGISYLLSSLINRYSGLLNNLFGMGQTEEQSMEMAETAVVQLSVIPLWLVVAGILIATGIGLLAGFYPAERAVRISALEAIRQEQ